MKTMEFCSGSMLHGFQGFFPMNFPLFSMDFLCFQYQGIKGAERKVIIAM